MKPTMEVKVGDTVKKGQLLFSDKKTPGVKYTSPATGTVSAINRGERRVFQSIVVDVDNQNSESVVFNKYDVNEISSLSSQVVQDNLVNSGLWTALRTRPMSKVPELGTKPAAIFVNAMDTNPLAADPAVILAEHKDAFATGLQVLARLTDGKLFLCHQDGASIPSSDVATVETFSGVHPAGLTGTHIHHLQPVSESKTVWSVGYQDVVAIGKLFVTGELYTDRVISIAGPQVKNPRLIRTRVGASLTELTNNELEEGESRLISGSVLGGRTASGALAFLGRYHNQVSVLEEGRDRPFLHYLIAGRERHSVMSIYLSKLFKGKIFPFTTTTNGSERAMVPIGNYEKIMPLDILPTQLLRALIVKDMETAINLGALELDEEDLALCTYVCAGKYEYGPILRANLTNIEQEG
jgi:Na+-transporting NADH:ubiquinone oxidoreductase subunit A